MQSDDEPFSTSRNPKPHMKAPRHSVGNQTMELQMTENTLKI